MPAPPASKAQPARVLTALSRSCSTAHRKAYGGSSPTGSALRVLRDSVALTRQAYLEFDLEAMFSGEVYADFVLLWLVCHQSRVEADKPEDCRLEQWTHAATQDGTRALDTLRDGVERRDRALGAGFLAHPANHELHDALRDGTLDGRRLLPPTAAARLPAAVPVRRRGPRRSARPERRPARPRALPRLLLHTPVAGLGDQAPRRPSARPLRAAQARHGGARRRRLPAARAAGARQLPLVADAIGPARRLPSSPTTTCSPRSARSPPSTKASAAPSTSATSAPRSSARSTSRCSSCTLRSIGPPPLSRSTRSLAPSARPPAATTRRPR